MKKNEKFKQIGTRITQGKFEDLLEILENRSYSISQKEAIYLIVCCCTACNANINEPGNLKEQDVIYSIKQIAKNIIKVSTAEYDDYLQSIFFICKLLLKKDFKLVLQIDTEILPTFIPQILTTKQKGIYRSLCELIRTEVFNGAKKKNEVSKDRIISIGFLISKIMVTSSNYAIFSVVVYNYGVCLTNLNVDLKLQYDYFLFNHEIIQTLSREERYSDIFHFIKYGMYIFTQYLKEGMLKNAKDCFEKVLTIIPGFEEWSHFKEMLKLCVYIIDSNIKPDIMMKYKDSLLKTAKLYGNTENFHNICKVVSQAITCYSYFCQNYGAQNCFSNADVHLSLYEVISTIMGFFTHYLKPCEKICLCSTTKNIPEGTKLATCISYFFSTLISNKSVSIESTEKVLSYFEKYCKFLVSLKANNCEKWDTYWADIAVYLYNLGVPLFKRENYDAALLVGHMILKYYSLLVKLEDEVLPNTMGLLSSVYLKQKKYMEAMKWVALEILNTKVPSRNKIFSKFVKIKVAARDSEASSEIQEFTIVSVIHMVPEEYECFLCNITNNKMLRIDLLIGELDIYHQKWKSKIPMMSAFRHLCDIADNLTLMKVFVEVFSDWEIRVHENVVKLLENIFIEFETTLKKSTSKTLRIYLVFLYFFRYKTQTAEMISRNVEEMNKTVKVLKAPNYPVDVMPADAYDQCDVVSAYESLKIDGNKTKHLERCLTELETIIMAGANESLFAEISSENVYTLTKNLAFEFKLHSDLYHSLKAWHLALNIAEYSGNQSNILECGGYLLRYIQDSKLEKKMDEIALLLKVDKQSHKYLIQYFINLSHLYLSLRNISTAYEYFNKAVDYLKTYREGNGEIFGHIDSALELLRFKLMQALENGKLKQGKKLSFLPLLKAHDVIVKQYTSEPDWGCDSFILLFEVLETLVKMYHDLKMPREVRCFGRQLLTLAQQHIIPVHSVKVLSYLAHADFRSERLDDCRVKLDGISEILLLENGKRCPRTNIREKKCPAISSVNEITQGLQEIMLDNFNPASFNIKSSPSSPVYIAEPYRPPSFASHENCKCIQCRCSEYHLLVISYFHLEALWYMHKKQITLSKSFFRGTVEFHAALTAKQNVFSDIFKGYSDYFQDIDKKLKHNFAFQECNYQCSLDYIKFLYNFGALEAAQKCSEALVKTLESEKCVYPNLYGEALLQRIGLIYGKTLTEKRTRVGLCLPSTDNLKYKTPEKCAPKIIVPKMNSPRITKFLPPKVIKFNLAESDIDESDKRNPSEGMSEHKTPAKTPRKKILPPSLRVTQTPLLKTPAKVIFSDDDNNLKKSTKTPKSRIRISKSCKTPSNATKIFSDEEDDGRRPLVEIPEPSMGGNRDDKIKTSKESNISGVKIKESLMEVRTKMLTSRLKKTNIEKVVPGTISNETKEHSSRKGTSRRKLLDTTHLENDVEIVRRSRRNRT